MHTRKSLRVRVQAMSRERCPGLPPATSGPAHDTGDPHSSEQQTLSGKRPREEGDEGGEEDGHGGGGLNGGPQGQGGDGALPHGATAAVAPARDQNDAGTAPPPVGAPPPAVETPAGAVGADAAGASDAAMAAAADMLAGADHAAAAAMSESIAAFMADPAAAVRLQWAPGLHHTPYDTYAIRHTIMSRGFPHRMSPV
jgi:hypothetical protein